MHHLKNINVKDTVSMKIPYVSNKKFSELLKQCSAICFWCWRRLSVINRRQIWRRLSYHILVTVTVISFAIFAPVNILGILEPEEEIFGNVADFVLVWELQGWVIVWTGRNKYFWKQWRWHPCLLWVLYHIMFFLLWLPVQMFSATMTAVCVPFRNSSTSSAQAKKYLVLLSHTDFVRY